MSNRDDIQQALGRMVDLLHQAQMTAWAGLLEEIRSEFLDRADEAAIHLLSLYGGMGSLNDVVLFRDGQVLKAETSEFDVLRTRVFELAHG